MGSVLYDEKNANDMANEPHELTHFPDALRYFATSRPLPAERPVVKEYDEDYVDFDEQLESLFEEF
jgi:phage terminase large subunit